MRKHLKWITVVLMCLVANYGVWIGFVRHLEHRRLETPLPASAFPSPQLARLDTILQARFAVPPTDNFGMFRVGERHSLFFPAKGEESETIAGLQKAKKDVVFYVAGRNFLDRKSTFAGFDPFPLQGPIYMTQPKPWRVHVENSHGGAWTKKYNSSGDGYPVFRTQTVPVQLPTGNELRAHLEGMLVSTSRLDHTATPATRQFKAGTWDVLAVPVRASGWECVGCHNYINRMKPPRLGDPVGIALYLTRDREAVSPRQLGLQQWLRRP